MFVSKRRRQKAYKAATKDNRGDNHGPQRTKENEEFCGCVDAGKKIEGSVGNHGEIFVAAAIVLQSHEMHRGTKQNKTPNKQTNKQTNNEKCDAHT